MRSVLEGGQSWSWGAVNPHISRLENVVRYGAPQAVTATMLFSESDYASFVSAQTALQDKPDHTFQLPRGSLSEAMPASLAQLPESSKAFSADAIGSFQFFTGVSFS